MEKERLQAIDWRIARKDLAEVEKVLREMKKGLTEEAPESPESPGGALWLMR
ncbi:MAG: hypothetical protein NUV70_07955 [Caldiserica bacterium]|nr:hypothetical protein [Caldisericota bacterium]